ncbi:MAG: hypothetical protein QOC64_1564 [Solirubrobacteraceae bacterium]|nr:hypothetical protein [Solirubrobacteraceae bacterium]
MDEQHSDASMDGRRILVVANETVGGAVLHEVIRFRARNVGGEVLVVAPALSSRLRHRRPDTEPARGAAVTRLDASLGRLAAAGIRTRGHVGDAAPMQAIADALAGFAADEVIIATHPEERSHWLADDLVARARVRFDVPVLHVVVGPEPHRPAGRGPGPRPLGSAPTLTAS